MEQAGVAKGKGMEGSSEKTEGRWYKETKGWQVAKRGKKQEAKQDGQIKGKGWPLGKLIHGV